MVCSASHELGHLLTHLGGVANDVDASGLERGDLVGGTTLTTSNDGTGVTHATSWRGSLASDETDCGQATVVVGLEPCSGLFLGLTSDLTDHDDSFGLGIVNELGENINEVGTVEGIATDSDDGGLSKSLEGGLVDSLVGKSTGTRDDTDFTLGVDVAGHDSNLALTGLDDTWAVRSDKTGLVLRSHD